MKDDKKKVVEEDVEEIVVEGKLAEEELDKASGGFYPWRPTEKGGKKYPIVPDLGND